MNKIKLNVKQAIETLNMSKSTLYNWMNEGRLKFQDSPRGRILTLTQQEIDEVRELNQSYPSNEQSDTVQEGLYCVQGGPAKDTPEVLDSIGPSDTDLILELTNRISEMSQKAGQANLLTDNLLEAKRDFKFWQDKYFEADSECKTLQEGIRQLKTELHSITLHADGQAKEIEAQTQQYREISEELQEKTEVVTLQREKIIRLEGEIAGKQTEISHLHTRLHEVGQLRDEYHAKLSEMAEIVSNQGDKLQWLEGEVKNKDNEIASLGGTNEGLKGEIGRLQCVVIENDTLITQQSGTIVELESALNESQKVLEEKKLQFYQLQEQNSGLIERLASQDSAIESAQEENQTLRNKISQLQGELQTERKRPFWSRNVL